MATTKHVPNLRRERAARVSAGGVKGVTPPISYYECDHHDEEEQDVVV